MKSANDFQHSLLPEEKRAIWPDILRIVAIFAVIMLHAAAAGYQTFNVRSIQWQCCNLYNSLSRFGVPIFVMLSGMFLLNPARNYTIKKLYFQKIPRMMTAFLFWSTFYAVIPLIKNLHDNIVSLNCNLLYPLALEITNGHVHLWFLFMISGLYMITPLLRNIVKDEKLTIYFLVLCLVFVFITNSLNQISFLPKSLILTMNRFNVKLVSGYSGYFVWGFFLSQHQLTDRTRTIIYIIGFISALLTAALNGFAGYYYNTPGKWMLANLSINILCMATAVFVFFQYHFQDVRFSHQTQKFLVLLGKWSFGIYLVHMCFHTYIVPRFFIHPILSIPISSIITFIFSLITVSVLSRIPILNKFIM